MGNIIYWIIIMIKNLFHLRIKFCLSFNNCMITILKAIQRLSLYYFNLVLSWIHKILEMKIYLLSLLLFSFILENLAQQKELIHTLSGDQGIDPAYTKIIDDILIFWQPLIAETSNTIHDFRDDYLKTFIVNHNLSSYVLCLMLLVLSMFQR